MKEVIIDGYEYYYDEEKYYDKFRYLKRGDEYVPMEDVIDQHQEESKRLLDMLDKMITDLEAGVLRWHTIT